ncbi:MAG TPA: LysR substrate-binding domain-containing protein [Steroidobacteraceae bacterium]|nr:LysR substrate-binding domain-containing protein [Steroidobacteraceae bacterium]
MALSHLRSLQALELALRTGSLKDAAAALGITPAAAGQRIKALEEYLGTELLVRGRSGLRAAPALGAVLPQLSGAFRELEQVATQLDMQRGHEVHVAAPPDLAELWLRPRLSRFTRDYPNIRFRINGEGDAPLRIRPADCEMRFGPAPQSGPSDVLFRDFVLPIGSPETTARIASVTRRDRLEGFPLLHLDFYKDDPAAPNWTHWVKAQRLRRTEPNRGIRYQRIVTVIEAVLANAGFTLCGMALLSELLESGRLSLPFPASTGSWTGHAFQARFRSDALARPELRRFREWLAAEADTTRQWLARATVVSRGRPRAKKR